MSKRYTVALAPEGYSEGVKADKFYIEIAGALVFQEDGRNVLAYNPRMWNTVSEDE